MNAEYFWMVAGDGPTSHRHKTQYDAEQEAKRLARLNPDKWFYVVEAISAHRKNEIESIRLRIDDSELPF